MINSAAVPRAIIASGILSLCAATAHAAVRDIVINEIAWMGTTVSTDDEWIELRNTTGNSINLAGWTLASTDGSPNVSLSGTLAPFAKPTTLIPRPPRAARPTATGAPTWNRRKASPTSTVPLPCWANRRSTWARWARFRSRPTS